MSFPYKHVLLIGATSGIGAALADHFIEQGVKVTAVGRRKDRLDVFVAKHGADKASRAPLDMTAAETIDHFVQSVTAASPDIDCILLNAGIQQPINLSSAAAFPAEKFHAEVNTNFTSVVNLAMKFLPFLQAKPTPGAVMFVGSHLGFVPAAGLPGYSASKAALAAFALCLREQLSGSNIKVVDIWPPVVQTELHDYVGPERGRAMGMPAGEFVKLAWEELSYGHEAIIVGTGPAPKEEFDPLVHKRNEMAAGLAAKMRGAAQKS